MAEVITLIASFFPLVPFIIGILVYKKIEPALRVLVIFLAFSALMTLSDLIFSQLFGINIYFTVHFFTAIEFIILFLIFRIKLPQIISIYLFGFLILLFIFLVILEISLLGGINSPNNYARALESIILFISVILYLFDFAVKTKNQKIENDPISIVSVAILFYFGLNLFLFLFDNYLSKEQLGFFWNYGHNSIFILRDILFTIALWKGQNSQ